MKNKVKTLITFKLIIVFITALKKVIDDFRLSMEPDEIDSYYDDQRYIEKYEIKIDGRGRSHES